MAMTVEMFLSAILIGVMGSNTGVTQALCKLLKVLLKLFTGEGTSIVTQELLGCHTLCGTELLVCCVGLQSLVKIQVGLQLNVSAPTGTVHHNASILALVVIFLISMCMQHMTKGVAHQVVKRCLLAREQFVLFPCASFLLDCLLD